MSEPLNIQPSLDDMVDIDKGLNIKSLDRQRIWHILFSTPDFDYHLDQ